MPASYSIDTALRTVFVRYEGTLTDDDLLSVQASIRADAAFEPSFSQLTDATGVSEIRISTAGLRRLGQRNPFAPEARRAVVADADLGPMLARVYQSYARLGDESFRTFESVEAARVWLGLV